MKNNQRPVRAYALKGKHEGKYRDFDSVSECSRALNVDPRYIKRSMDDPMHVSNRPELWGPKTVRGELRKRSAPTYRFEDLRKNIVKAVPLFEHEEARNFKTDSDCYKFLDISHSTYYDRKRRNGGRVTDKYNNPWLLVFLDIEADDTDEGDEA